MIRSALVTFVASIALVGLCACGQSGDAPAPSAAVRETQADTESKIDLAEKVGANTFIAKNYGLTVTAPEGWYVMDSAVTQRMMDVGKELTTTDMTSQQKAAMDMAMTRSTNIFGFMKFEPGAPRTDVANILGMAEDVSVAPGIKRGSDYFFHLKRFFKQSGTQVEITDGYTEVMIDGQPFDRMDLIMTSPANGGLSAHQRYFAARHGKDVIGLIQTYVEEEDLATLDAVIDSIKLDWK